MGALSTSGWPFLLISAFPYREVSHHQIFMEYQHKMAVFVKLTHFQHLPLEKLTLEPRGENGKLQQCLMAHVLLQPL